ncbi:DUF2306 domain-containing protein [Glaciecola petra]|uniref:DUF2306 domain-containing protein n=1 Tax=Glaciecola petra TaxID=3075602 RepID=A0ABU2ZRG6_9ALTE|nr:DUF2306 domain-containing protein [Aestuariibacter sp. P117]MDT0595010.1 DUF2306 domain-containing protein [Aestuariibacter sp. P117]
MSIAQTTSKSRRLFNLSLKSWFICLVLAQITFAIYLSFGYGLTSVTSGLSEWNRFNQTAYVPDDSLGNAIYAIHVLLAIIMMLGGSLQFVPTIRKRFSTFHRYNGRLFVTLACTISLAGIYLIIVRGTVGNTLLHSLTAFSGVVILVSSFFAIRAAKNRNFTLHQIWATRLFLAANGVLFFRLMIFAWMVSFGALGINTEDFTGPTVVSVSVLSYLAPLLIAELVRYTKNSNSALLYIVGACLMFAIALVFIGGLFAITIANWYPLVMS